MDTHHPAPIAVRDRNRHAASAARLLALAAVASATVAAPAAAQFINGDFEDGTFNGWTLEYAAFFDDQFQVCTVPSGWTTTLPFAHPQPKIHTGANEPGQTLTVLPYEGTKMARINDINPWEDATRISQAVTLTSADLVLGGVQAKWGAMLQNPSGHDTCQPRFTIEVRVNGGVIEVFDANGAQAGQTGSGWVNAGPGLLYKDGLFCTDISGYAPGDVVEVRMTVQDCGLGAHSGFAYIDDVRFNYCCAAPPPDMVGWWPLDEPLSPPIKAADLARGNGGLRLGNLVEDIEYVDGSLVFDGSTTRVAVGDPADGALDVGPIPLIGPYPEDVGEFSSDAWIRTTTSQEPRGTILWKLGSCNEQAIVCIKNGYSFQLEGDQLGLNLVSGHFIHDDYHYLSPSVPLLLDGNWHLVAFTVDRTVNDGVRFYVDGNQVGPGQDASHVTGTLENKASFTIGAEADGTNPFDGNIDEVEFFKRELEAQEIVSIYDAGSAGKCKEYCLLPNSTSYWLSDTSKTIQVLINNDRTQAQTYKIHVVPELAGEDGCDVDGPTAATWGNYVVQPHKSLKVSITVPKPVGLTVPGEGACYSMRLENINTGYTFECPSRLTLMPGGDCMAWLDELTEAPVGLKLNLGGIISGGGGPSPLDYEIRTTALVGGESVPSSASLNGLPPGVPVTGSAVVPVGVEQAIDVSFMALEHIPFGAQVLEFHADIDGDGSLELAASTLIETAPGLPLSADVDSISVTLGGTQTLNLHAGEPHAGLLYLVLGSASGTDPGVPLGGGVLLPLNLDGYLLFSLQAANLPPLNATFGLLDSFGGATASISLPPGLISPVLVGLQVNHAYVLIQIGPATAVVYASNAVALDFVF